MREAGRAGSIAIYTFLFGVGIGEGLRFRGTLRNQSLSKASHRAIVISLPG